MGSLGVGRDIGRTQRVYVPLKVKGSGRKVRLPHLWPIAPRVYRHRVHSATDPTLTWIMTGYSLEKSDSAREADELDGTAARRASWPSAV